MLVYISMIHIIQKLHLIEGQVYDIKYNPGMDEYLNYHNDVIYVGMSSGISGTIHRPFLCFIVPTAPGWCSI